MKKKYYDIKNILETHAQYIMLLGERANGKSYQVKKTVIESAYKNRAEKCGRFVYLRRWKEDIKIASVQSYFEDTPINKLTNGEYDSIVCFQGFIYFAKLTEKGIERHEKIGRYCALNEAERYKSNVFAGYDNIIYEEFITNQIYLNDEPANLQHFVSTVFRDRRGTVFLVGNTLSRVCPYFVEWNLDNVLNQPQGQIDIYHFHTLDGATIDIAVEYCASAQSENKMFFGQTAKNIIGGVWDTKEVPKLPRAREKYELIYTVLSIYKEKYRFVIELLFEPENGGFICFVYPYTKSRYIARIISDTFSDLPNISYSLDMTNKCEKIINKCFRDGKICFSDNLTGADFENVNKYFKIGQLRL